MDAEVKKKSDISLYDECKTPNMKKIEPMAISGNKDVRIIIIHIK